jgi:hypothetical protein
MFHLMNGPSILFILSMKIKVTQTLVGLHLETWSFDPQSMLFFFLAKYCISVTLVPFCLHKAKACHLKIKLSSVVPLFFSFYSRLVLLGVPVIFLLP